MKLVVDISPEDYEYLKSYREFYDTSEGRILKAVCNGKDAMAVIADVIAIVLTGVQLEIEELDSRAGYDGNGMPTFSTDYIRKKKVNDLIQQKINSLKRDSNEA